MSEQRRAGLVIAGGDEAAAEAAAIVDGMSKVANDDVDAFPRGRRGGPPARVVCNDDDASLVSNISTTLNGRLAPAPNSSAPPDHDRLRVVHRIRLSSIRHNYDCVEGAAARQHCSVIAVVKADAYGHGAAETAMHLVDRCGCDAFAVASLEEAIALRRALAGMARRGAGAGNPADRPDNAVSTATTTRGKGTGAASWVAHSQVQSAVSSAAAPSSAATTAATAAAAATASTVVGDGSNRIRIMVLGPPVGYPRCFDAYHHNNIEAMITGPDVAAALVEWVRDAELRKRAEIESSAAESKEEAATVASAAGSRHPSGNATPAMASSSVTLSNVQGNELLREVQAILTKQKAPPPPPGASSQSLAASKATATVNGAPSNNASISTAPPAKLFQGISEAAKDSRNRAAAAAVAAEAADEASGGGVQLIGNAAAAATNGAGTSKPTAAGVVVRKRLRWHALVDSGMGRLGFKPEDVVAVEPSGGAGVKSGGAGVKEAPDLESCRTASTISSTAPEGETGRKGDDDCGGDHVDPVSVIKMLHDAEVHDKAPIEFYGMCTHMAEATEGSSYTKKQMSKFVALIEAVRDAGILIHTISTDNSSALLTPSLDHFTSDRSKILNQDLQDTRGYVRVGGAIYGQRPAFSQLRTVSTLLAWVRHVATHGEGDSVGYDRAYVAERDVRIATVTIGFADGYPRDLGNGVGRVCIRGRAFPVAGNVCMDMIMVDLGPANDPDCPGASVEVGDEVVLWGPHTDEKDHADGNGSNEVVKLKDLAAALKTTQSALTCGLDKLRVSRQYI